MLIVMVLLIYMNVSFEEIILHVSISDLLKMYDKYHEMDIMQFVDKLNKIIYDLIFGFFGIILGKYLRKLLWIILIA